MKSHSEKRWALAVKYNKGWHLMGPYCWPDATLNEPRVRTFRTREEARHEKERLTSYRHEARPVKVKLRIIGTAGGE